MSTSISIVSDRRYEVNGDVLVIARENRRRANTENVVDEQGRLATLDWNQRAFFLRDFCDTFLSPSWREDIGHKLTSTSKDSRLEVYSAYLEREFGARFYVGFTAIDFHRDADGSFVFPPELVYLCARPDYRGKSGYRIGSRLLEIYEQLSILQGGPPSPLTPLGMFPFALHIDVLNTSNARTFYAAKGYRYAKASDRIERGFTDDEADELRAGKELQGGAAALPVTMSMYKILKPILDITSNAQQQQRPSSAFRTVLKNGNCAVSPLSIL